MSIEHIIRPCRSELSKYNKIWEEDKEMEKYRYQEDALNKLFGMYPKNEDISDVLLKASVLNDFYKTNILSIFPVAKHILELHIDDRLNDGDLNLIDDIKHISIKGDDKMFYSFATKYCSHHRPSRYPIYDSYVSKVLRYFRREDEFCKFSNDDLKNYSKFKEIILGFLNYYELTGVCLKKLDRYLWLLGRRYFKH